MEKAVLTAIKRTEKPNKVRKAGFIPGVLNKSDTSSISVQFDAVALTRILSKHGANAKGWIVLDDDKKFGFFREVQTNPVTGKVIHVSIQLVTADEEVKMQLPVIFRGQMELEHNQLQAQICKSDMEVSGKTVLMPEKIEVDVAGKKLGDTITANDFKLPEGIKILDSENEIYAVIKEIKQEVEEEPEVPEVPASAE